MRRARLPVLALVLALSACTGADTDPSSVDISAADASVTGACGPLIAASWPVAAADDAVRAPFEANEGWLNLVTKRDLRGSVQGLGPVGGLPTVRAHAEASAMYRQAALLSANALTSAWGKMGEASDPLGGAHLLAVAHAIRGDLDAARKQSARLDGAADEPTAAWHAPWKAWLAGDATWPPDLSGLPLELPEPTPGTWPEIPVGPHYRLTEQSDEKRAVDTADLGVLVAAALWHDATARAAAEDASHVDLYVGPYRFPVEEVPETSQAASAPLELLFGSDYLGPRDPAFLAAVTGEPGAAAVEAFKGDSLLACLASEARSEGKVNPEKAIDLAASTREAMVGGMREKAGGETLFFHRTFADIGQVSVLRGLAFVAEAEGDHEASGRLRLLAYERSNEQWTADPTALLSMAAWDASNEYPLRATEILHNLIRRYPSLETARFGVDVLALRVSRRRGGPLPGQ